METDPLFSVLAGDNLPLLLSAGALLIALIALWLASGAGRETRRDVETLRQKTGVLGREMDDLRVSHFHGQDLANRAVAPAENDTARYLAEKEAYDRLWPQVWHLHDRLGMFLRAVEGGEAPGELRLEARNAALEARNLLNRNRPFCNATVEELVTRLIDTEIRAHLAACQYLDLLKEVSTTPSDHDRRVLQDKCHSLHEGESRELMNRLADAIRARVINVSCP
ncbi:hypothetical protein BKP64_01455 [Marinobacter salinus]|uniref:Uncharacterized protein n=1 Tax=Marinobacter salinus TaxID=1874317 RepID=A0A1D9GHU4_9GAMM|nr:hypothetical protein [Marinobacter salinus]AOY86950.1 hypothetical protein BKP64_01455 [Marinobacter salinus]